MRSAQPKGDTDRRDLKMLLLAYPQVKVADGAVIERLRASGATDSALAEWATLVALDIQPERDGDEF